MGNKVYIGDKLVNSPLNLSIGDLGYTVLEYIESDGTQYIDTGVIGNLETRIEIKCQSNRPETPARAQNLFGSRKSASENNVEFLLDSNLNTNIDFGNYSSTRLNTPTVLNKTYIWFMDKDLRALYDEDRTLIASRAGKYDTEFTTDYTMYLLQISGSPASNAQFIGKLYYCKIWDNGTLVRDFVPALDYNGIPCMWDRVENKPYYNKGTDEFKYKMWDYQPLDYIESSGTQWIDTGVKVNSNTTLESIAETTSNPASGDAAAPISARSPEASNIVYGAPQGTRGNTDVFWVCWGERAYNAQYKKNIIDGQFHEHKININGFYLDGTLVYAITGTATVSTSTQNVGLFARPGANGVAERYGNYKMKSAKIWDNDVLVRDFIPVQRLSDNTIGMYDKITNTFFKNKGTGTFVAGYLKDNVAYKRVSYINCTGTQYTNIGIKTNQGLTLITDFNNASSSTCLIGARETQSVNGVLFGYVTNSTAFNAFGGASSSNTSGGVALVDGNRHVCTLSYDVYDIDGVNLNDTRTPVGPLTKYYDIYLGTWNNADTADTRMYKGKIYGVQIYDNNELVADLIPVLNTSTNVAGFWDTCRKQFFASLGQPFQYG